MALAIAILVFLAATGAVTWAVTFFSKLPESRMRKLMHSRLQETGPDEREQQKSGLIKVRAIGPVPLIDAVMRALPQGNALADWLEQSGSKTTLSGLFLVSFGTAIMGVLLASAVVPGRWTLMIGGAVGFFLPMGVLKRKRTKRLRRFEEHFPEALELLSRAARAGHAFNTGSQRLWCNVNPSHNLTLFI